MNKLCAKDVSENALRILFCIKRFDQGVVSNVTCSQVFAQDAFCKIMLCVKRFDGVVSSEHALGQS